MATAGTRAVDQSGRTLGPRALHTRQRLLDATAGLLNERSLRDISVVEIARKASTSPATFYQYFKDVSEATLRLAEQAVEETPALVELVEGPWRGQKGLDTARALVTGFVNHWDDYRPVLLVRNLAAEEGDRRFQRVRRQAVLPVIERLAKKIEENQKLGRIDPGLHPAAAAAAMATILERLAAYHKEIEFFGAGREELIESCARILYQTVTGRSAPAG